MKEGNEAGYSWNECFFATAGQHYQLLPSVFLIQQQSCDRNCQTFCKTLLRVLLCASITKANVAAKSVHPPGKHGNVWVWLHIWLNSVKFEDKCARAWLSSTFYLSKNGLPLRSQDEIVLALQIARNPVNVWTLGQVTTRAIQNSSVRISLGWHYSSFAQMYPCSKSFLPNSPLRRTESALFYYNKDHQKARQVKRFG